jgi:hypothetical protein
MFTAGIFTEYGSYCDKKSTNSLMNMIMDPINYFLMDTT